MPVTMPRQGRRQDDGEDRARARGAERQRALRASLPGTSSSNSSVVRAMIGIIITPSAKPPAIALNCLNGSTATPYANRPMTIDGTPLSVSAAKRVSAGEPRPRVLGHVDAADHADRHGHQRGQPGQDERADDRVGHPAARLADRLRQVREEVEVDRANALRDDEEEDHRERNQRR